jgi:hypothetical protein
MGIDVVGLGEVFLFLASLPLAKLPGGWLLALGSITLIAAFFIFVHMPFDNRERLGRARRRRGECVWCGQADVYIGDRCPTCGNRS